MRSSSSLHAVPLNMVSRHIDQTIRLTSISLILPIARVGFSPFGQTSTQFMIEWQRNRRYGILEVVEALVGRLIAGIGKKTVSLQQAGRADELVRIPPERRARRGAAGAQNALVEAVQFLAVLGRLQALASPARRSLLTR